MGADAILRTTTGLVVSLLLSVALAAGCSGSVSETPEQPQSQTKPEPSVQTEPSETPDQAKAGTKTQESGAQGIVETGIAVSEKDVRTPVGVLTARLVRSTEEITVELSNGFSYVLQNPFGKDAVASLDVIPMINEDHLLVKATIGRPVFAWVLVPTSTGVSPHALLSAFEARGHGTHFGVPCPFFAVPTSVRFPYTPLSAEVVMSSLIRQRSYNAL